MSDENLERRRKWFFGQCDNAIMRVDKEQKRCGLIVAFFVGLVGISTAVAVSIAAAGFLGGIEFAAPAGAFNSIGVILGGAGVIAVCAQLGWKFYCERRTLMLISERLRNVINGARIRHTTWDMLFEIEEKFDEIISSAHRELSPPKETPLNSVGPKS